ncbi:MAG: histidinol-phosphate transaminase [Fibrobacteraceae bacterium]|nr:histidinol-phosphate transaminase [Fibrobacteraceae bacterium]
MIEQRPELKSLSDYVPGKSIEEIQERFGLAKVVKLASNENPLGPSPKAIEALQKIATTLHLYPRGDAPDLISAIAKKSGLLRENIILGNGSDEIIDLISKAFIRANDECISFIPTFSVYKFSTLSVGGTFIAVDSGAEKPKLSALLEHVTKKTRVIFICNPNNPTGWYFSDAEIRAFLKKVPSNVLVFLDEAYAEFATAGDFPQLEKSLGEFPNLFLNHTFSKIYGLAGLRIGYAYSSPEVIKALWKVKPAFDVNRAAQIAAVAALSDEVHIKSTLASNASGMKFLVSEFESLGYKVIPSEANFICVHIGENCKDLVNFLEENGMIIRYLKSFDMPEWIRVTIGLKNENEMLMDLVKKWKSR